MTQPPFSLSSVLPVSKPPRRSRWWLVALAVVVVAAGVGAFLWFGPGLSGTAAATPTATGTALRAAYLKCHSVGEISDADKTLYLDGAGSKSNSGGLSTGQINCVLTALAAPAYVTRKMEGTRALDGRVSDTWGNFEASWTYHPDNGLDILIRQVKV